jgi:hypothetical protein
MPLKRRLAVSALLPVEKGKALKDLAKLEKQLATDVANHYKKTEAEKLAAMTDTLNKIQKTSQDVFGLIDGVLNARQIATKNKLKDEQDAAEKKAARDIELVNASTLSEQDKAAKITVINARLASQKEQIALKGKESRTGPGEVPKGYQYLQYNLKHRPGCSKAACSYTLTFRITIRCGCSCFGRCTISRSHSNTHSKV